MLFRSRPKYMALMNGGATGHFQQMAESPVDRRAFFQQGFRKMFGKAVEVVEQKMAPGRYVRPPGALTEAAFLGACTRCGECVSACPVHAIKPLGIEGNLRGLVHKMPGGKTVRPDLVLIDDPQTRESAASPHQVRERIATINPALARGYAYVVFNHNDCGEDTTLRNPDGSWAFRNTRFFPAYPNYDWGLLRGWAWGVSRIVDYLEQDSRIDAGRLIVTGASRTGKSAMVAAAFDERIAMGAPVVTGGGGIGTYRHAGPRRLPGCRMRQLLTALVHDVATRQSHRHTARRGAARRRA